jgi:septal ring factor EnvC (AmiA/AmiB activator)|tara:strand:+ start:561 stop:791 length:231 start_codon:yes stop_codon:yes gene_type:complete
MNKITESELESLKQVQQKFAAIKHDLGTMVIREQELLKANEMVVEENTKLVEGLQEKYGKVNINLEDGSYEEIKEE